MVFFGRSRVELVPEQARFLRAANARGVCLRRAVFQRIEERTVYDPRLTSSENRQVKAFWTTRIHQP